MGSTRQLIRLRRSGSPGSPGRRASGVSPMVLDSDSLVAPHVAATKFNRIADLRARHGDLELSARNRSFVESQTAVCSALGSAGTKSTGERVEGHSSRTPLVENWSAVPQA